MITAYAPAFGSLLLLGGKVSDLVGRKRTFVAGLLGFAGASAAAGAAPSFGVLIAARAVQGLFAAVLAPAALSIVATTLTDARERARAFAVYGAVGGSGAAVGLILGGAVTAALSWRWTMYVNLAIAIPAAIAAGRLLVNVRPPERPRLDLAGTVVATSGLFALVYGFASAEREGWGAAITVGALAYGSLAALGFVALERRVAAPLLPLRVPADRNRGGAFLALTCAASATFSSFLLLSYYMQGALGFSAIECGLAFLPMASALMLTSMGIASRLLPRLGPRVLVPGGLALAAAGLTYLTGIDVSPGYAVSALPGMVVIAAGFGLAVPSATATATRGVAPAQAGVASAMVNACQQVGGSLGVSLLSTIFATAASAFVPAPGTPARQAETAAALHGYVTAFRWSAVIVAAGALAAALLLEGRRRPAPEPAEEPGVAVTEAG